MTRRFLLGALAAAIADPERLLWTPGKKLISIPKPSQIAWILEGGHWKLRAYKSGLRELVARAESWDGPIRMTWWDWEAPL